MNISRALAPSGAWTFKVKRHTKAPWYWRFTKPPRYWVRFYVGAAWYHLARGFSKLTGIVTATGVWRVVKIEKDGRRVDYGPVSYKVVTTAFVNFIVDALDSAQATFDDFDFIGFGSGTNAEDAGDTALQTEFTTQYATDNVRPTGTVTQPSANVFQIVATFTPDAGVTVQEVGVLNQAAVGGGILMDRGLTGGNVLAASESLQSTYQLTINSGG